MIKWLLIISILIPISANAQLTNLAEIWKDHEYKADALFEAGLYEAAIEEYQKALTDGNSSNHATVGIAEAYKKLADYNMAVRYYNVLGKSFQLDSIYFENYADALLSTGDPIEAQRYYEAVLAVDRSNKNAREKILGIRNYSSYFKDSAYVKVEPVSFNTASSEYALRHYADGMSFVSSRGSDLIIQHNYLRSQNKLSSVYKLDYKGNEINNPEVIQLDGFRKSNDGPLTKKGNTYAMSRTIEEKGATLGIYFYELDSTNQLIYAYDFPYNSPEFSLTHPAFSQYGDTLFFASDLAGGFGGLDIYYSVFRNNIWSAPINLGEPVNGPKNETFPYSDNGVLYFSSDGHAGIGGIDTYKVVNNDNKTIVENLGAPINSGWDDFAVFINNTHGFISSNRPGGVGLDDIYEFYLLPRPKVILPVPVNISVLDNLSNTPVENALITIYGDSDTLITISNSRGAIQEELMPGNYTIEVKREPYVDFTFNVSIDEGTAIKQMVRLEPAMAIHVVSPDSIMFKFGEYNLLNKEANQELDEIVTTLNKYPEFNLKISAHTDSRGEYEYNLWLSEMRAETAANYLIDAGIDSKRIEKIGYGENRLLNNCRDGFTCSEQLHKVNRRIEFDFIRNEGNQN